MVQTHSTTSKRSFTLLTTYEQGMISALHGEVKAHAGHLKPSQL